MGDNAGMPSALLLPVLTCAAVLLLSGVAKLRAPDTVDAAFTSLQVPSALDTVFVRRLSPWVEVALGAWLLLATGPALVVVSASHPAALRRLPRARGASGGPPGAGRLRVLRRAGRLAGHPGDGVAQRCPRALGRARHRRRAAGRGPDRRRDRRRGPALDRHGRADRGRRGARRLPFARVVGRGRPDARRRRQLRAPGDAAGGRADPGGRARAAGARDDDVGPPARLPQPRVAAPASGSARTCPSGPSSCCR